MSSDVHKHCVSAAEVISPALADALQAGGPIEFPKRNDTAFEHYLARAVAGQQLSVKAARSIWNRVEVSNGDRAFCDAFCASRGEDLRACGLSNAKVKTLIAIGQANKEGWLDGDALRGLEADARAVELTGLWGVGQWTADMANMFWFGEEDIWPDGDVAARKTLERLTSPRRKTVRTAERFAPYRSYLALYMWRHVDAPPT